MFEIPLLMKLFWTALSGGVLATFTLWPIGDKPTTTDQKVCFIVMWAFAIALIFGFIKMAA